MAYEIRDELRTALFVEDNTEDNVVHVEVLQFCTGGNVNNEHESPEDGGIEQVHAQNVTKIHSGKHPPTRGNRRNIRSSEEPETP